MASAVDDPTDRVRKYRQRKIAEGGVNVQFQLMAKDADALVIWRRLIQDHGGPKAAVLHLLRQAAGRNDPTDDELLAMLSARLRTRQAADAPVRQQPVSARKRTGKSS